MGRVGELVLEEQIVGVHSNFPITPAPNLPESLIHGAVPADEGAGSEQEDPEDGQPEARAVVALHTEAGQAGEEIQEQSQSAA